MPVIINEVEVLQPAAAVAPAPAGTAAAPTPAPEPAEDLRRWLLDAAWRAQRLVAN